MGDQRDVLARRGELEAERFLTARGMKILSRRFRIPAGEVDLIMRDDDTLVFVEVKTQRDRKWNDPELRVDAAKRNRLWLAAQAYIRKRRAEAMPCRFDIVAVTIAAEEPAPAEIRHYPDAFHPPRG